MLRVASFWFRLGQALCLPFSFFNGRPMGACLIATVLCLGESTHAGTAPPVALEQLAERSDRICYGVVRELETARSPSGVSTRVTLDVHSTWKGSPTNRLVLALAGGTLGDRRFVLLGQPEFTLGEEVVLFTRQNERGEALLVELAQGKFTVRKNAAGEATVSNGVFGQIDPTSRVVPPHQRPLSLETLQRRVRGTTLRRDP